MLKSLCTILLAAALVLGAPPLVSLTAPPPGAMTDRASASSDGNCKSVPPCCVDGLGCAVSALLPLPEALHDSMPRLHVPPPLSIVDLRGIAVEPELFPPIRSL